MDKTLPRSSSANRRRNRRRQQGKNGQTESANSTGAQTGNQNVSISDTHPEDPTPSSLTYAIRTAGLLPLTIIFVCLALPNHLYSDQFPDWLVLVLEDQVAILTLCAGQAAIIGLLISVRGRPNFSTYALYIAAGATALAGEKAIGDTTGGHLIVLTLFLSFFPAVWAEKFNKVLILLWNAAKSRTVRWSIILTTALVLISINQYRDENYIRNWLIIPFGILLGIIVAIAISLVVINYSIKLSSKLWGLLKRIGDKMKCSCKRRRMRRA